MAKPDIPMRPKGRRRFDLQECEKDCLVWYVLSNCKKEDAYLIFVRPDLAVSRQNLKLATSQFFASTSARDFLTAYKDTLEGADNSDLEGAGEQDREKRAGEAVQKFTDKIVDKMGGDFETVDEMDAIAKLADRVGVLDDKEKVEMRPVRVLPTRCKSECRYRLLVEGMKSEGKIFDDCDYCKAKRYAEEHGFKYDPCTVLDVPQDVIDEIDSKNNVRLEDIIRQKVEN